MTWSRIDEGIFDDPKVIRAIQRGGSGAVHLYIGLIVWCSKQLSDGEVPADMVTVVPGPSGKRVRQKALDALIDCKLITRRIDGGLTVVNYLKFNKARVDVLHDRGRKAKNQQDYEDRKNLTGQDLGNCSGQSAVTDRSPDRSPVRSGPLRSDQDPPIVPQGDQHIGTAPSEGKPEPETKGARKKREPKAETALPADFAPTDDHRDFAAERGLDLAAQLFAFKQHYRGRTASSWNGRLATWLTKAEPPRTRPSGFIGSARPEHTQQPPRRTMTVEEARRQRAIDEGSAA